MKSIVTLLVTLIMTSTASAQIKEADLAGFNFLGKITILDNQGGKLVKTFDKVLTGFEAANITFAFARPDGIGAEARPITPVFTAADGGYIFIQKRYLNEDERVNPTQLGYQVVVRDDKSNLLFQLQVTSVGPRKIIGLVDGMQITIKK